MKCKLAFLVAISMVLAACAPVASPSQPVINTTVVVEPSSIPTTQQPTDTSTPQPTNTPIPPTSTPPPTDTPTITPMPGSVVYPIDTLARTIPWLPLEEEGLRTGTTYLVINMKRPPFNNPAVRQALAAAVDREALAELAVLYYSIDPEPATSFIPPSILSRDLYGIVGIPFDPTHARELLAEAGYKDSKTFPVVKIITSPAGTYAPGARLKFAEAIATMWEEYLGITVEVQGISSATFKEIRKKSPPDVSFMAWAADYYDPHIFSGALFKTNSEYSEYNYGAHIPHLILAEIGNIK